MEPNLNTPQFNPEQMPGAAPESYEVRPQGEPGASEVLRENQHERREQAGSPERTQAAMPTAPILPTPVVPTAPTPSQSVTQDDNAPQVAADADLIEKEWVDKAKKIISETRDDPHRREEAVSALQRDYLKKRYGKELDVTD